MNAAPQQFDDLPQLDPQRVEELRRLRNGAFFVALAQGFREQGEREIAEIRQALEAGDLERSAVLAHSLKSSSLNIGAQIVGAITRRLEGDLHEGRTDSLTKLCAELEDNFQKTLAELQQFT
jgi:HPt (histidine-containing phosphotransfer) domain-containing protein